LGEQAALAAPSMLKRAVSVVLVDQFVEALLQLRRLGLLPRPDHVDERGVAECRQSLLCALARGKIFGIEVGDERFHLFFEVRFAVRVDDQAGQLREREDEYQVEEQLDGRDPLPAGAVPQQRGRVRFRLSQVTHPDVLPGVVLRCGLVPGEQVVEALEHVVAELELVHVDRVHVSVIVVRSVSGWRSRAGVLRRARSRNGLVDGACSAYRSHGRR